MYPLSGYPTFVGGFVNPYANLPLKGDAYLAAFAFKWEVLFLIPLTKEKLWKTRYFLRIHFHQKGGAHLRYLNLLLFMRSIVPSTSYEGEIVMILKFVKNACQHKAYLLNYWNWWTIFH